MSEETNQEFEVARKKIEELLAKHTERQQRLEGSVEQTNSGQRQLNKSFVELAEMVSNIDHRVDVVEFRQLNDQERARRLEELCLLLYQMIRNHDERIDRQEERVDTLKLSEERVNTKFEELMETHKHTEERLDAFIYMLERYISEGRNHDGNGSTHQ